MDGQNEPQTSGFRRALLRLKQRIKPSRTHANETRIRRRQFLVSLLTRRLSTFRFALFFSGYLWMVAIPSSRLGRGTYIDENALQPGQVSTYWNWGDVHNADKYLGQLEALRDANSTSQQRAQFIVTEFRKLGISASTQNYMFSSSTGDMAGSNAYAILNSPRASGTEAMVISASWLSRTGEGNGTLNLRGVSTVLALAAFLERYSLWAKDIIFLVSDGYLEGMHAWLSSYHGSAQTNLRADRLELTSGVIWTALNIDYSGHSFSHLGIFFEGLNGRLPNQDLLNSFQRISRYTGGVPVIVYDHLDPREQPGRRDELDVIPSWIPTTLRDQPDIREYAYQARNIIRHVGYQARGRASGVHGLLHQFRIDAITLFALPAPGPHGFHAIGRIIESTLRTTNNLLERLHASFFFFILTSPDRFMKIGSYLPSVVLISIAMMFGGLRAWVDAAWIRDTAEDMDKQRNTDGWKDMDGQETTNGEKTEAFPFIPVEVDWSRRRRPVMKVLAIMASTHALGVLLFSIITTPWFAENAQHLSPILFAIFATTPLVTLSIPSPSAHDIGPPSTLLKAFNLCLASTVISITTVLNFSLAASLAVLLGIPLSISSPSRLLPRRIAGYSAYTALGLGWLLFSPEELHNAVWNWEILKIWFAPFVCMVYTPLVLQAGLVCLLPP